MNLNSPDTWRWIWFVMAAVFAVSEMASPATFFFLPFAIGAVAAGLLCIIGLGVLLAWVFFFIISAVAFAGLWKLGRKFDQADVEQEGVGATRLVGQEATVFQDIPDNGLGMVRMEREEWRAESLTGNAINKGTTVTIARIAGTRLVVLPVDEATDAPQYPQTPIEQQTETGGTVSDSTQGEL